MTDSQFILALSPSGTHGQILAVIKTVAVLLSWGILPDWRIGLSCNRSQSLSVLVIYIYIYIYIYSYTSQGFFVFFLFFNILLLCYHLLRPAVHVLYSRFC
jgi:hypothetical protein